MAKNKNVKRIPVLEFVKRELNYKPKRLVIREHDGNDGVAPSFGMAEVVKIQLEKLNFSPNVSQAVSIPCDAGWYEPQVYNTPEMVEVVLFEHNGRPIAVGSLKNRLMLSGNQGLERASEFLEDVASVVGGRPISIEEWHCIPREQRPTCWFKDQTWYGDRRSLVAGEDGRLVSVDLVREGRTVINGNPVGFTIEVPDSAVVYKDQDIWNLEIPS